MTVRATPKQYASLSIRAKRLLTEPSMQPLCSGMLRLPQAHSIQDLQPGRAANSCRLSSSPTRYLVWKMELSKAAMSLGRLVPRAVSSTVEGCLRSSLSKVGAGQETEDCDVLAPGAQLGRYVFENCLALTSITFAIDQTNKSRTLPDRRSVVLALPTFASQATFTTSAGGHVKTASGSLKSISCVQRLQPYSTPPLPSVSL